MTVPPAHEIGGLLADDRWMRRLALRLAPDPQAADDLVQDAWVAALSSGEEPVRRKRPWLGGIVRNLWRDLVRTRDARRRREERAARGELLPSSGELAEELELRQRVATALLELEEPYRRTLTLRYFRDLSLREIAEAEGLSIAAIHEREQRGLSRLRARLGREARDSWAVTLLALARPAGGLRAGLEVIAMASGWKLAAAVVLVGGGLVCWWPDGGRGGAPIAAAPVPEVEVGGASLGEARDGVGVSSAGESREPVRAGVAPELPVAPEPARLRGRVIDARGEPQAGLVLAWDEPGAPVTTSAADGSFALEALADGGAPDGTVWIGRGSSRHGIHCADRAWATLVAGAEDESGRSLVVVAPRTSVGGVVVGSDGAPLVGAELVVRVRDGVFRRLGVARPGTEPSDESGRALGDLAGTTDALGRFELGDVPGGEGLFLAVSATAHQPAEVELQATERLDHVIVLEPEDAARELTGLVIDDDGHAVEGARVSAGDEIVRSDAEGRFRLSLEHRDAPPTAVQALLRGHLPARASLEGLDLAQPVVLQLGPAPLAAAGHVLDAEGRPRAGIAIWARDPTPFGREVLRAAESMTASFSTTVEDELAGGFGGRGTLSTADGSFRLEGLTARRYQLLLFDPASAERAGPFEVDAGAEGLELVLPGERCARVAGRIVSLSGEPLAGVQVRPQRGSLHDVNESPPPRAELSVTTDDEGRFAFERLCTADTLLVLMHPKLLVRSVALAGRGDLEHLELAQAVLCDLQVDLTRDPGLADTLQVLDEDGRPLELVQSFGVGFSMANDARFTAGLSEVLAIRETAAELVLLRGGTEVLRRPLHLDPEERTVVRP